jgi:uncharacterized RDD family membrane protein YckC
MILLVSIILLGLLSIFLLICFAVIRRNRNKVLTPFLYTKLAGFWTRTGAFLIDLIILMLVNSILLIILKIAPTDKLFDLGYVSFVRHPLAIIPGWIYFAIMESSKFQATIGKMVFNIYVTTLKGDRILPFTAITRHLGKLVTFLFLGIGFLTVAFSKKKQGLHDRLNGTLVYNNDSTPNRIQFHFSPTFE